MAFNTDAGGVVSLRVLVVSANGCCAAVGVGVAGSGGVHLSNLPFFDICWTKIISLLASENPRKLVAVSAFRLNPPVAGVLIVL